MKEQGIDRVAIIGAGLMGFGIGLDFARFGYEVNLYNTRKNTSELAMKRSREALDLMVETELITADEAAAAYKLLRPTIDLEEAVQGAGFVVESAPETPTLKQDLFARLDVLCDPEIILASNTSALRITDIALKSVHQERILRAHYFQPAHFIPIVEVHGGEKTDKELVEKTARILRGVRKKVVIFNMDLPGAVGSRIQGAQNRDIQALIDEGICDPQTMDDIIEYGFGRRLAFTGFFKRQDLLGLDFVHTATTGQGQKPWGPLEEHYKRGEFGMKSGKGFYDWPGDSAEKLHRKLNMELIRLLKQDMENGSI